MFKYKQKKDNGESMIEGVNTLSCVYVGLGVRLAAIAGV